MRRPVERYIRHQFQMSCGVVELGVSYADGHHVNRVRHALEAIAEIVAETYRAPPMSPADADKVSAEIDEQMVSWFGDVARFIEVWRNEDEPLTQWYAPHGWPRDTRG